MIAERFIDGMPGFSFEEESYDGSRTDLPQDDERSVEEGLIINSILYTTKSLQS